MKNRNKRNILALIICGFCVGAVFAQSIYPKVEERKLANGIPVYYMENTTNKIDSIIVGVKGGPKYYTPELSGIENATFLMLGKGSVEYTYEELQSIKYKTSSTVKVSSGPYGSWISLNSIDEYLDETLPMYLDGIVHPIFKEAQYDLIMKDYSNSVQQTLNDPYSLARYYAGKIITQGHPYETAASVQVESIDNITLSAIRDYYSTLLDSSRFYVIACTKKPLESLMPLFEEYLNGIPEGTDPLKTQDLPPLNIKHEPMVFTHQAVAGSGHVFRAFEAPSHKSDESIAYMIAETVYNQIMHNVVRAKYGACYSAWSEDSGREANVGYEVIYRCSDFSEIKTQIAEARQIMADGKYILSTKDDGSFVLGDLKDGFEGFKNSVINALYSTDMTTAARTGMLNSSLLMYGNTTGIYDLRAKLNTVTYEQVNEVFNKYFLSNDDFWFAVTGPDEEEAVMEALSK